MTGEAPLGGAEAARRRLLDLDRRGNLKAPLYESSRAGVFTAGDARIGQSLIVNAIAEGRRCARVVEAALRD